MESASFLNDTLSETDRKRVAVFVDKIAGIQLPESKKVLIETRLRKRQKALGYSSLKEYVEAVLESGEQSQELVNFLDALTTNKTGFYREEEHFTFLIDYLSSGYTFQNNEYLAWSAGCSSGEEPYTLAIELLELSNKLRSFHPKIAATDISISSLRSAVKGVYSHDKIEMMPLDKRRRHLLRSRDKVEPVVKIAPETQSVVDFAQFNLISGDYQTLNGPFDAIFCRNVMIYFNSKDRQMLTERFCQNLKTGGLLFIGHSESLLDKYGQFERLVPTIYRKRAI